MIPRDYQEYAIKRLFAYFAEKKGNPIVALPTGTGKSLVIGEFLNRAYRMYPKTRAMMVTHVKELIEQNMKNLLAVWPSAPAGIYSAGVGRRESHLPITFAGIQSVYSRAKVFGHIDILLIDECHLVNPKSATMYQKFINELKVINPKLKVIGLSATAYRMKDGLLTEADSIFTDFAVDLTSLDAFNWLVREGWLSRLVPKKTSYDLDVSSVRVQGGEYVQSELQAAVDKAEVTLAALREAVELAGDRAHWLVFATGIEHAEHVADALCDMGIVAAAVHSQISSDERAERLAAFKRGEIKAVVNNNVLTTGFDFPQIDCIVMLRPTASPGLWVQMLGRGTRPVYAPGMPLDTGDQRREAIAAGPKPDCLVLDFAGNTARLGPINDPVLPKKRGRGAPGLAPVRLCEVCGCYNHASARVCEFCGHEFPRSVKLQNAASTLSLINDGEPDVPVIETFEVKTVVYSVHRKDGRPDSMRVDYGCGLRKFTEYVCLDHSGYAAHVAQKWWTQRCQWGVPPSVHDGMKAVKYLREPTKILVKIQKARSAYPEIVGYEFS